MSVGAVNLIDHTPLFSSDKDELCPSMDCSLDETKKLCPITCCAEPGEVPPLASDLGIIIWYTTIARHVYFSKIILGNLEWA